MERQRCQSEMSLAMQNIIGESQLHFIEFSCVNIETFFHRFGPLVWRTSKERRKTKTHRRDKCNSGDSGIQVELENDENLSENVQLHQMVIRINEILLIN